MLSNRSKKRGQYKLAAFELRAFVADTAHRNLLIMINWCAFIATGSTHFKSGRNAVFLIDFLSGFTDDTVDPIPECLSIGLGQTVFLFNFTLGGGLRVRA